MPVPPPVITATLPLWSNTPIAKRLMTRNLCHTAHPVGPCHMPLKAPDERRLSNLRWSVAGTWIVTYTLIVFYGGLSTIGGTSGPEHRGLREANRIVPSIFLGFAVS